MCVYARTYIPASSVDLPNFSLPFLYTYVRVWPACIGGMGDACTTGWLAGWLAGTTERKALASCQDEA